MPTPPASEGRNVVGKGAEAVVGGERAWVGSARFATEQGALDGEGTRAAVALEEQGKTVSVVFRERRALGLLALRDEPLEVVPQLVGRGQGLLHGRARVDDRVRVGLEERVVGVGHAEHPADHQRGQRQGERSDQFGRLRACGHRGEELRGWRDAGEDLAIKAEGEDDRLRL